MAEQVVFRKSEVGEDNDIWDDTALIKAYDNAIKDVKCKAANHLPKEHTPEKDGDKKTGKKKKNRRKQKGKAENNQQKLGQWSVGAPCRAVFTEDGAVYEAVVRALDPVTRSAVVRYRGYGNEEEQCLDDLLPSLLHHPTTTGTPLDQLSVATERGSFSDLESVASQPAEKSSRGGRGARSSHNHGPVPPPFMPPPPHHSAPIFPPWAANSAMGNMTIPPPPPPMPPVCGDGEDTEALYSMLMAWYMSGFHTGYYQGKKAAQK